MEGNQRYPDPDFQTEVRGHRREIHSLSREARTKTLAVLETARVARTRAADLLAAGQLQRAESPEAVTGDEGDPLEHARGVEWLHVDAVQSLNHHDELLEFTHRLIAETKSLVSELSAAAPATATPDLIPPECQAQRLEERCRFWRARVELGARALDDHVVQVLYGVGMTLEAALLRTGQPELQDQLQRAVRDIDELVEMLRGDMGPLRRGEARSDVTDRP